MKGKVKVYKKNIKDIKDIKEKDLIDVTEYVFDREYIKTVIEVLEYRISKLGYAAVSDYERKEMIKVKEALKISNIFLEGMNNSYD